MRSMAYAVREGRDSQSTNIGSKFTHHILVVLLLRRPAEAVLSCPATFGGQPQAGREATKHKDVFCNLSHLKSPPQSTSGPVWRGFFIFPDAKMWLGLCKGRPTKSPVIFCNPSRTEIYPGPLVAFTSILVFSTERINNNQQKINKTPSAPR
jgi:hypothetical protein